MSSSTNNYQFVSGTPDQYKSVIINASQKTGVPTALLSSAIKHESGFNPYAISPAGAEGIAQFMPATAKGRGVNPWDVNSSINGMAQYLADNYKETNSWPLALAGYNAGMGAVMAAKGIPNIPETVNYVNNIMGDYNSTMSAYNNQQNQAQQVQQKPSLWDEFMNFLIPQAHAQTTSTSQAPQAKYAPNTSYGPINVSQAQPASAQQQQATAAKKAALTTATANVNTNPSLGNKYTVKAGDTLWDIAQKVYGNGAYWHLLQGYTGNPRQMPIGTQITVPNTSTASGAVATAPPQTQQTPQVPAQGTAGIQPSFSGSNQTPSATMSPTTKPVNSSTNYAGFQLPGANGKVPTPMATTIGTVLPWLVTNTGWR